MRQIARATANIQKITVEKLKPLSDCTFSREDHQILKHHLKNYNGLVALLDYLEHPKILMTKNTQISRLGT